MAAAPQRRFTAPSSAVHRAQTALLDGAAEAAAGKRLLQAAASLLSRADFTDVVTERSIGGSCGYPLCANPLPPELPGGRRGRFRIALREHRVYDLAEARKFCSEGCLVASAACAASLEPERPCGLLPSQLDAVVALFEAAAEGKGGEAGGERGLGLGFLAEGAGKGRGKRLDIREKEVAGRGEVSLEEWIGPADAVDGYVPRRGLAEGPKTMAEQNEMGRGEHSRDEQIGLKSASPDEDEDIGILSSLIKMQDISEAESKKLEEAVPDKSKKTKKKKASRTSTKTLKEDEDNGMLLSCISDAIAKQLEDVSLEENKNKRKKKATRTSSKSSEHKPKKRTSGSDGQNVDFRSAIIVGDHALTKTDQRIMGQCDLSTSFVANKHAVTSRQEALNSTQNHLEQLHEEFERAVNLEKDETTDGKSRLALRPSLKTAGSKNRNHSVRWADEENTLDDKINTVPQSSSGARTLSEEDIDSSRRRASAEACAAALNDAARVVSSGTAEAEDAVSKAGVIILPGMPPQLHGSNDEDAEEQDTFEFDRGVVKWPKKTMLSDTDMFEVEDSWHDTPPEGFNLTLSAFATMWSALFEWISRSSLGYIYGLDESTVEELLIADGREYPKRIVLKEGHSYEVKKALGSCMSNDLPELVLHLGLRIPVSMLEMALTYLLDTMSFVQALPPLKSSQWQVITLVLVDALSVHRLPALAPVMANTALLQKVLDSGQIGKEEYDLMVSHVLPFGRWRTPSSSSS